MIVSYFEIAQFAWFSIVVNCGPVRNARHIRRLFGPHPVPGGGQFQHKEKIRCVRKERTGPKSFIYDTLPGAEPIRVLLLVEPCVPTWESTTKQGSQSYNFLREPTASHSTEHVYDSLQKQIQKAVVLCITSFLWVPLPSKMSSLEKDTELPRGNGVCSFCSELKEDMSSSTDALPRIYSFWICFFKKTLHKEHAYCR